MQQDITLIKYIFAATIIFDAGLFFWFLIKTKARSKLSKIFLALLFFILSWEVLFWIAYLIKIPSFIVNSIDRFMFSIGGMAIFFSLYFIWELGERIWVSKKAMFVCGFISFLISLLSLIPNMVLGERIYVDDALYNFTYEAGYLYVVYHVFFALLPIVNIFLFYKVYTFFDGLKKQQLQLVGFGLMIAVIFVIITVIWLPLAIFFTGDINFGGATPVILSQLVSAIGISIFTTSSAYAITRYRFMNIRIIIKKSFLYGLILFIISVAMISVVYVLYTFMHTLYAWIFFIAVIMVIFPYVHRYIKQLVDKKCFLNKMDLSQHLFSDRLKKLNNEIDDALLQVIQNIKSDTQYLIQYFFLIQRQHNRYTSYYPKQKRKSFPIDSTLFNELATLENIIFVDERLPKQIYKFCQKEKINILLLVREGNNIMGILALFSDTHSNETMSDKMVLTDILKSLEKHIPIIIRMRDTVESVIRQKI